ncbi:SMC-Scp complex subunit ScpB [Candidatus Falkowbacteria bacterium]|uniref:SMC-Scp complex subunit ScpB n=1 Tax=Candidatus Falkowbacteria bacterium CG10_big_fil_rev_8_21_14_0_10_37_18 TaxID=1974562 RepID=A0A2H0V8L1_9BACT|nr:SMC-Scp complex subunit ScpB [Candidatus Falkowbacteria bacterium]NCQ13092.1 SMC-Scp complex subunit ScpB [Candidatus Falkowbacteria bacterium]OIO05713.1 MAG: SMC-Scp complex subunit ScpB [Candidatus Falkowbacteria bacterium CG1_02_37_21]PIR95418.1 MAG: SMC-Scp complex subunit ScpB [Candidatus Falkowbacteria bacterium CG10_big_fil_rev_8_21_14_0_10_37_18]
MLLKSQLESLLFVSLKPLSVKDLASAAKVKTREVEEALLELEADYQGGERGLTLMKNNAQYQITTAGANADLVKEFLRDEATGELSQPSLETLTIIAYRGPIAKLELERIRGVNCSLILRHLIMRGLVEEKFDKAKDQNYYSVTHDFVRFLGMGAVTELPEYEKLNQHESLEAVLRGELAEQVPAPTEEATNS